MANKPHAEPGHHSPGHAPPGHDPDHVPPGHDPDHVPPGHANPEPKAEALMPSPRVQPDETVEVVTFTANWASYFVGESAAFVPEQAQQLREWGVIEGAPTAAPTNVDVPAVIQSGTTLVVTNGNWNGTPTAYAYQWSLDGVGVGSNSPNLSVTSADVGKTANCIVTASNVAGATAAPPSNDVVIADPNP